MRLGGLATLSYMGSAWHLTGTIRTTGKLYPIALRYGMAEPRNQGSFPSDGRSARRTWVRTFEASMTLQVRTNSCPPGGHPLALAIGPTRALAAFT
jgi:hypothetical protein